jgi:hypothetical protein
MEIEEAATYVMISNEGDFSASVSFLDKNLSVLNSDARLPAGKGLSLKIPEGSALVSISLGGETELEVTTT